MILHHLVTNGYQGTITRKQSCSVLPPAPNLNWFHPHAEPRSAFKFHVMSAEESGTGTRKYSTHPPGSRSHPFPSLPPSVRPSRAHPTPQRPESPFRQGRAGGPQQPRATCGHRPLPCPERPSGARRPRRRALTAGRSGTGGTPGSEEHGDRRDSRSRSAATAAAVASCFDVSGTVARPPPAHRACAGPTQRRPRGGRGGAGRGRERRAV